MTATVQQEVALVVTCFEAWLESQRDLVSYRTVPAPVQVQYCSLRTVFVEPMTEVQAEVLASEEVHDIAVAIGVEPGSRDMKNLR